MKKTASRIAFYTYNKVTISNNIKLSRKLQIFYSLKVFTNEKRGGVTVVKFDRPRFKLFSLKFSNISVQAPSCERS
jgi:hypothetical protein